MTKMVRFVREKDGESESAFIPLDEFAKLCLTAPVPGGPETLLKLLLDGEVNIADPTPDGYKLTVELGEALIIPVGGPGRDQRTGASPVMN